MYRSDPMNLIYFALLTLSVYFTGKLAVKRILDSKSKLIAEIVRNAVNEGLNITTVNKSK